MAPLAKRRKLQQVEEITFDTAARQEYLTGFHKRKQQRIQNARESAAKREKEEKVKERQQLRAQRQEDLAQHVAEVKAVLKRQNPETSDAESVEGANDGEESAEWNGIVDQDVAADEEYVDEDKFTTVTVEALDLTHAAEDEEEEERRNIRAKEESEATAQLAAKKKRPWAKDQPKKKKFRYESKAERQAGRKKQKIKDRAARDRRKGT